MEFSTVFIFIIALGIGAVAFLIYYFSSKQVIKRKLEKANFQRVSSFISGETAKVAGKIEIVGEPLRAPLSGRPCACYHVLVQQQVSSGKSSHWDDLIEDEKSCPFVLRDGRSCAYIESKQIKSYLVEDMEYSSGFLNDATEDLENYLRLHDMKSVGLLGMNKTLRYKEGILESGENVAVYGRGEWKLASSLGLPDSYNRVLAITSTETDAVYLSDDPDTTDIDADNSGVNGYGLN